MLIRIRVTLVIIITMFFIILFGFLAGTVSVTNSNEKAQETDLMLIADIADQFIGSEIDSVKMRARVIAQALAGSGDAEWPAILASQGKIYPEFIGMAVLDSDGKLSAPTGELPSYAKLPDDPYVRRAFQGETTISSTIPSPLGVVFYLAAPIPGVYDRIVVISLPGSYFSDRIVSFVIWDTGHIFVNDAEGNVIAHRWTEWVQDRHNIINLALTDKEYEEAAHVIQQGVNRKTGIEFFSLSGKRQICALKPVTQSEEGWFLGVVGIIPESPFRNTARGLIVVGFVSFFLSIIAAIIASWFIKKPFEEAAVLKEIAEANSEAKSRFVANMSHEMRTPMNSIIGFSELAMNDNLPDETKDFLNKILVNSELLLQIINDVLDISKIESGKLELEHISFDLHELLTACRIMITPGAEGKGVNLFFYAEPSIDKRLLGDPLRLRQVLLNLLSNAVKFTGKGGMVKILATVTVPPVGGAPEGGEPNDVAAGKITISFEVKDSGIGISPEQLDKISKPFTQADTATTRRYGGTGLGLAICKNIIELMGGTLKMESTLGVGSKFSFEITFDTLEPEEGTSDNKIIIGDTVDRSQFSGEILLCEDNQMNQQVLCEHLKRVGIKADVAENGREGFNMVRRRHEKGEKPYDLIFMDIHMPVMDGLEASTLIKKLNTGAPIVAMTANVMSHDRELYLKTGMKDCIGKPFRVQELWNCLSKYLTTEKWDTENKAENKELDEKLKFSLIVSFVNENKNRHGEITDAINSGDIKLANRLAHTLKSNAGLLGKTKLQEAAKDVEYLLKDGESMVTDEHLNILEAELTSVLDELTPLAESAPAPASAEPLSTEKAREVLAELKPLLERGNPDCMKYIDTLRGIQGTGEHLVRKIIQHMENLDFEQALETFNELMSNGR